MHQLNGCNPWNQSVQSTYIDHFDCRCSAQISMAYPIHVLLRNNQIQRVHRVDDEDYFLYDVFVSYADTDSNIFREKMMEKLEENRGLRLLIHETSGTRLKLLLK